MLRAVLLLAAVSAAAAFSPASFLAPTSRGATQFGGRAAFTSAPPARVALATGHAQQRSLRPVGAAAGGLTMEQAFGIVITGAAAGVGFAYADEFLSRGHKVVIGDVSPKLSEAAAALREKHAGAVLFETKLDVADRGSVEAFADFAKSNLGQVDYWINNAGINGGRRSFLEVPIEQVEAVVRVNLLGALFCTQYAMKIMTQQAGVTSHLFNTVGSGVKGGGTPGYVCYGATKRGQPQMTSSLADELTKGVQGYDKVKYPGDVKVHTLSPGMVFTQLLLDDSTPELRKFPFGVLAAQPEEVAADLVPKILANPGQGKSVEFLTTDKVVFKLFERFALGKKSEYIDDDGNVIRKPGAQYNAIGVRALF